MTKRASTIAKGLATAMVLFHHLFYSTDTVLYHNGTDMSFSPFGIAAVTDFAQLLKIGVAVFVFVTGYGTAKQYILRNLSSREKSVTYTAVHVVKLLLGFQFVYAVFALLSLLFPAHSILSVYGPGKADGAVQMVVDFFGLAYCFGTPTLNGTWWYMSLALLLIVVFPFVWRLSQLFEGYVVLAACALGAPLLFGPEKGGLAFTYAPAFLIGICFAQYSVFERIDRWRAATLSRSVLLYVGCIAFLIMVLRARQSIDDNYWCFDAVCASLVCLLCSFASSWTHGWRLLEALGKHSMNIFLTHTFLYNYFFDVFYYSLDWFLLSFAALVCSSLVLSWALEKVKRLTRFTKFVENTQQRAVSMIFGRSTC